MGNVQQKTSKVVNNNDIIPAEVVDESFEIISYPTEEETSPALDLADSDCGSDDSELESDSDSDSDSAIDSDDDEDDQELLERLQILQDAKMLKQLAVAFLHPELPVGIGSGEGAAVSTRCYFDRPSAPQQESFEDAEYRQAVLEDVAVLRQAAKDYLHPELGVTNVNMNMTASVRCYFDRPSAPIQESAEDSEYRQMVLKDAASLKKLAVDYLHPEAGVPRTIQNRCYFDRPSAPQQESVEDAEYRQAVLADAASLKKLAIDYLHPEVGVTRISATARCYFDRPSAPQQESPEDADYREAVLADAASLKRLAVDYLHPEIGVTGTTTARCYFDRPSAPQQESPEDADYRQAVLADAASLKKLAIDYLHPEIGVTGISATARCYFDRPSAPQQETPEDAEYREAVLADAASLKKLAIDYLHPEVGVVSVATARCYFDRPSAPQQESVEDADYREEVLADAASLKKLAVDYLHPEVGVTSIVATARCYFDRSSAPQQESPEDAEYRQAVLADAASLKRLAVDYLHPEVGVVSVATARCYFDRPSAPQQESVEDAEYREAVLADAASLKKLAVDYLHPEVGVVSVAMARCYFDRPSAPQQESVEDAEYRQAVLADAASLKRLAVDYLHPEVGVISSTATARCYFDRPSAPEQETAEEAEHHNMALEDISTLKKLAVDYLHPEIGVDNTDPTATARCYFDRPSELIQGKIASSATHAVAKMAAATQTGVKTLPTVDSSIPVSLSSVQLFGLDKDSSEPTF